MAGNDNLISGWDWANKHVQPRNDVDETRFVNGATVLISAGPPRLAGSNATAALGQASIGSDLNSITSDGGSAGSNIVFPIGVCMNANISQNRGLQRIYEIGSDRCYFVQGRSAGGLSLERVLFNGANILRVLYAYYPNARIPALGGSDSQTGKEVNLLNQDAALNQNASDDEALNAVAQATSNDYQKFTGTDNLPSIKMNPGHNNMYVNLASDLFQHPIGIMFTFQDNHKVTFANFYCEMVYIVAHGLNVSGQSGTIVAESVQAQFDRILPVKVT